MIEDSEGRRVLYVSLDNGMVSTLLRIRLMARLAELYGPSTYTNANTMISGELRDILKTLG